jgi:hypothetical protein
MDAKTATILRTKDAVPNSILSGGQPRTRNFERLHFSREFWGSIRPIFTGNSSTAIGFFRSSTNFRLLILSGSFDCHNFWRYTRRRMAIFVSINCGADDMACV